MISLRISVLGLVALLATAAPCDLKKVQDGFYCKDCDQVIDEESCAKCNADKDEMAKTKADKCQVCVKVYFECEKDQSHSWAAGKCKCGADMVEKTDKARVIFACESCKKQGEKEGACDDAECAKAGKKVVRTCSKSGTYPHVPQE
jgi:hypothetical protein